MREFWSSYRSTFGEMRSEFRNVFATEEGAALEWTTQGTSNGEDASYDGVSILEIEGAKQGRESQLLRRTATVLQPGWYGPVRSGMADAAMAEILALVSYVPPRDGTH